MSQEHRADTLFQDQVIRTMCRALIEDGAVPESKIEAHLEAFGGWRVVLADNLPVDRRPAGLDLALGDVVNHIVDLLRGSVDPAADYLDSLNFDRRAKPSRLEAHIEPRHLVLVIARQRLGQAAYDRLLVEAEKRHGIGPQRR